MKYGTRLKDSLEKNIIWNQTIFELDCFSDMLRDTRQQQSYSSTPTTC